MAVAVQGVPSHWHHLTFWSDVHLHAEAPDTHRAWARALSALSTDALFILGDLFEVWVGDDVLDHPEHGAFWRDCADALRQASRRFPVWFMPGNRDFLVGDRLLAACGMQRLADPTVLDAGGGDRWLLGHGDAWCLADAPYQRFRAEVRSAEWQARFLAQPLDSRMDQVRALRQQSQQAQALNPLWADADEATTDALLTEHQAHTLIHGHTHRPQHGPWGTGRTRWVLSDWEAQATPPRLAGLQAQRPPSGGPFIFEQKSLLAHGQQGF